MKCPYCKADIDNKCTECPSCGRLITSNIKKEIHQYEKSIENGNERIKSFVDSGKGHISELGSKGLSGIKANKRTILWILGWIFVFPIPALILIMSKKNNKMNDASKAVLSIVVVLCYIFLFTSIISAFVRGSAAPNQYTSSRGTALFDSTMDSMLVIPVSSGDTKSLDITDARSQFEKAGFVNIISEDVYDLDPDTTTEEVILDVTVGGQSVFNKGDKVAPDTEIKCICHHPFNKYTLNLSVDFIPNLIFDTYDVTLFVDDEEHDLIKHGNDATYTIRLKEGNHTISFHKNGSVNIKGQVEIDATCDIDAEYKISCHSDRIDVETNYIDYHRELPEDEAKAPCSNSEFVGKNYNDIINQFRTLGFTDIKVIKEYDIIWGVTEKGSIDYVTIDGTRDYRRGDTFKKDAEVIIAYHLPYEEDPSIATQTPTPIPSQSASVESSSGSTTTQDNSTSNEALKKEEVPDKIYAVATTRVKIRKEPNTDCDVLGMLEKDDKIEVIGGKDDEWSHVKFDDGEGYVKNEFLSYDDKKEDNSSVDTTVEAQKEDKKVGDAPFHSSDDMNVAKKGNKGVYAYKRSGPYTHYYIIDFDKGYVYYFNTDNDSCEKIKIVKGTLADKITITYHDGGDKWNNTLSFNNSDPTRLRMTDNYGSSYVYEATDLNNALKLKNSRQEVKY